MGLLNYHTTVQSKASAGDAIDQVFAVEQAEKKLGAAKIRWVWIWKGNRRSNDNE